MAFNAMKLRMAMKDESEHQADENYLVDVSDVFTRGILRDMGIEHEMFGGYGKLQSCSAARAILWTHLRETDRHRQLPLDVGVHTYRFRRAEVNHGLRFGDVYKGKVRVGVDRTPNFQNTPSEKLDVVLYDAERKSPLMIGRLGIFALTSVMLARTLFCSAMQVDITITSSYIWPSSGIPIYIHIGSAHSGSRPFIARITSSRSMHQRR